MDNPKLVYFLLLEMPDWLLERIFPYTQQVKVKIETLASSKTILNMNTTTLKFIAVGIAGGLFGLALGRIYFSPPPPVQHEEKSTETAEPAEPEKPEKSAEPDHPLSPMSPMKPDEPPAPISSIEQIDTSNPFNNKKFDPILNDKEYVIGFMYKMEALKKALSRPPPVSTPKKPQTLTKIGYANFDNQTRDLLL